MERRDVGPGASRPQPDPSNLQCIQALEVPNCPPIAVSARVQGPLTVTLPLMDDGSVREVIILGDPSRALFKAEMEEAVAASRFAPECGGRTVTVMFEFVLSDVEQETVSFAYPNRFTIESHWPPLDTDSFQRR